VRPTSLGGVAVPPPDGRKNATSEASRRRSGTGASSTVCRGKASAPPGSNEKPPVCSPGAVRVKIRRSDVDRAAMRAAVSAWSKPRCTAGPT
jgi:hypothetical protein